ncbi:DUF3095 family protein, partial [bacterium]|nr:DUF3095 family protein [bacterium]
RAFRAFVQSGLVKLADMSGRKLFGFDSRDYRRAVAERCDYRKAAGGPRFVLDVTENEAKAIEALLERYVAAAEIRYGVARSAAAAITCRVG